MNTEINQRGMERILEDFLHQLMGSPAGPAIRMAARILAPVAVLLAILRIRRQKSPGAGTSSAFVRFILVLLFVPLLLYQASWQLTGSFRPQFMAFIRRHSARPDSPASRLRRGRILSADGGILAEDRPGRPGRRRYPLGPAAAHLVGYVDPRFGLSGVESVADGRLSGSSLAGFDDLEKVARSLLDRNSLHGEDVRLSIDSRLQRKAYGVLAGRAGALVALDPRNGAILALASSPGFDPTEVGTALHQPGSPMLNRALQGRYPPGSAFKILTATMALEAGIPLRYDCPADGFRAAPDTPPIRDHAYYAAQRDGRRWRGYGSLNLEQALVRSSNTYFAQLGIAIGPARFDRAIETWGLRRTWRILQGDGGRSLDSQPGSVPAPGTLGNAELAQLSIGQGRLLITPLHGALMAAGVANDGWLVPPRLRTDTPAEPGIRVCRTETARELRRLLRAVVRSGTARAADVPGLEVAGKTGTAQVGHGDDHSWFVCLAPASNPNLVVAVVIEHGGYGSAAALPAAVAFLQSARRLNVPETAPPAPGVPP